MLTQMFHQRHQRNHQMNGKHPIQKIHSRQESTTVQTLIASSINKKSTVNPEIIRFTPNALQLFLGEIKKKKKKSNDNTSIPVQIQQNKIQVDPRSPRISAQCSPSIYL